MNSGFILINKPKDWTSHDVVGYLRKVTGIKKIGHAGTLDPFATGLLIVGIGREATKRLDEFKALNKGYIATLRLGATSDTYDSTGEINNQGSTINDQIDQKKIKSLLKTFIGKQEQIPPMYSAKKVGGKKLYELARKGIEIDRKPSKIEIHRFKLIEFDEKCYVIRVSCLVSTGTYIRTLAHDIGQALGCGAYCEELERTKIGKYSVKKALRPKEVTLKNIDKYLFV
ncbi:tRNA pseudouridine(55) synthase TruB [Patescibacteria group bacterium]|nr:tRNA pseudouridine(55) synthase TruB [Patescibacteria group bacterium]MBU1895511.1 tRNA pseudouridine(55) synthase TruB [Patescibacteria group bacterium]